MKKFLIVFLAIFLIGGIIYFSQNHNLKDNSTSPRKLSSDTRIYKSDNKGDFKIYKEKNYQDGHYLLKKRIFSESKSNDFDLCLIFGIKSQKIISVKDVSLETEGKGFQGTVYVEIVSDGKSLVYDIFGDLSEGHLERPILDIKDMGRKIDASFSSLSESKSLDHVDETGAIFLPWMF
ncbi:hypothetical protein [Peptoniphilus sp. HMSC062D09]|uniref:hypothetical protein n=1 Tax=Peptoniphilus TaxID=162289 RepID=UPI0008A432B7|nr:hypothetical protein [Peptoniphilus sp. HMSC062D09]OFK84753.1 hypothetical protein HMPREF2801_02560 [Peptoniphilus sp. HMSC062D09]